MAFHRKAVPTRLQGPHPYCEQACHLGIYMSLVTPVARVLDPDIAVGLWNRSVELTGVNYAALQLPADTTTDRLGL